MQTSEHSLIAKFGECTLEAAPIGGQLFAHGISGRDCIAFCLLLDTYDTRLLAQALIYRTSAKGVFS
jgi:hypothetical protein